MWRKDLTHPELPAEQVYASSHSQNFGQYSPDGKHVVFDSDRSGVWSLWLADSDGSNLVQLTRDHPAGYPRWSPDSRKIVFEMTDGNDSENVYVVDIADRLPHKLQTGLSAASSAPSWSGDGTWIYFRGYEGPGHQIYRVAAEGGQATVVAKDMEFDAPMESADHKFLYAAWGDGTNNVQMLPLVDKNAPVQNIPGFPELANTTQWFVSNSGIYVIPLADPRSLLLYNPASQSTRQILRADKDLGDGLGVSPDGRYLLFSQISEQGADIMLVDKSQGRQSAN